MKTKKLSLREYVDFVLSYIPEMNIETIEQWYSFNECQKTEDDAYWYVNMWRAIKQADAIKPDWFDMQPTDRERYLTELSDCMPEPTRIA